MKSVWQIQEAKDQFSQVVRGALSHGAQTITRHGKAVVVVIAAAEYRRTRPRRRTVDVLRDCPSPGLELDRLSDTPGPLPL